MEVIFELIFQLIAEVFLQIFAELLLELGMRSLAEAIGPKGKRNPFLAFIGYGLFGLIAGGLSLIVFPHSFVRSSRFYGISLVIAPIFTGLTMSGIGYLRKKQGETVLRIDTFFYGSIFAFGMALIRLVYTD